MERPMRLRLDLTEVNLLPFKFVWVPLSPRELLTIGDFKSTLYQKFDFDKTRNIKLFVQNSLLLDNDTVLLLREDDTVKVVYDNQSVLSVSSEKLHSSLLISKKKKKRKRSEYDNDDLTSNPQSCSKYLEPSKSEETPELTITTQNKYEILTPSPSKDKSIYLAPELTDDSISKKKHKKKKNNEKYSLQENIIDQEDKEYSPTFVQQNGVHKKKKRKTITNDFSEEIVQSSSDISIDSKLPNVETHSIDQSFTKTAHASSNDIGSSTLSDMKQCNIPKEQEQKMEVLQGNNCRKKKRNRRRKNAAVSIIENQPALDQTTKLNAFYAEPTSNYDRCIRKHIIFAENSYDNSAKESRGDQTKVVDLSSYLQQFKSTEKELNKQNLSDGNISNNNTFDFATPVMSTPRNSVGDDLSRWGVTTVMKDIEDQTTLDNSKSDFLNGTQYNDSVYGNKIDQHVNYTTLPPLNTIPEIGTRIAFKLLELSDLYCPEVSDFKEGIVKNINSQTDEMEVELAKEEVKQGRTGKFENIYPDEEPIAIVIKNVKLNWSSLIEPKLVSKT